MLGAMILAFVLFGIMVYHIRHLDAGPKDYISR